MDASSQSLVTPAQLDPSGRVNLEDPAAVRRAIEDILLPLHGCDLDTALLARAIDDLARAYGGGYPGLLRSDTLYHDLRHALEAGLTMARLIDGMARADEPDDPVRLDARFALLGVLLALYHDIGLLRRDDEGHLWGPMLTPVHEERGTEFMHGYLAATPLADLAGYSYLIMPTKLIFKIPPDWPALERRIGSLIATADLMSQTADRCYLEKCRDFLFLEFGAFGLAGHDDTPYPDRETLLAKTPGFVSGFIRQRLDEEFGGAHRYLAAHFGGDDPYAASVRRNLDYLADILATGDFGRLRRQPKVVVPAEL